MNLDRLRESLEVAVANGVEVDADERKVRVLLGLLVRVAESGESRQARIAEAVQRSRFARERREAATTTTFHGSPSADDDLVVVGTRRSEHGFRLLHRADGTLEFFGDQTAVVVTPDRV